MAAALARTTHLGIGAHQDDLEFMALHGIGSCHGKPDSWFSGITCTDGGGSPRTGDFARCSDAEMRAIRKAEQEAAARLGEYALIAQLAHPSEAVRDPRQRASLVEDLVELIRRARPGAIYTHNPFDRHPTHLAVFHATIAAIRKLPPGSRPQQVLGCEVWRGLDWLPDPYKVVLDVSAYAELSRHLAGAFPSQIAGGKRYDLAIEGRRRANATFHDSHAADTASHADYAIDLTPLIQAEGPSIEAFVDGVLSAFSRQIRASHSE